MSEDELLPSETLTVGNGQLKLALRALARKENRGILFTGSAAALCALREPELFWGLMQRRRVALVDGPISLLYATVPPVALDLVTVDWQSVAVRIVSDLVTQAAWIKSKSLLFHAKAHLGAARNRFCREI